MELRSRCCPSEQLGGRPDCISVLPDDLLLLILARLGCAGAAARTDILSRRWRGLWPRLRQIVFRDVPYASLEAALGGVSRPPPPVSLLEFRVPDKRLPGHRRPDSAGINSLLLAAAGLEPEALVVALPSHLIGCTLVLDLPYFHRTASIVLDICSILSVPAGVEFPALETLSLSCFFPDLDSFIPCCPRLRTLRLGSLFLGVLRLNSVLLQEIVVDREAGLTDHISIVAPVLRQLTMSFISSNPSIFVSAPMLEKVSWRCCYTDGSIVFGFWLLEEVLLRTAETQGQLTSLHIHFGARSLIFHGEADTITQDIEKHMIAEFSILELHLRTSGHMFGALTFHLLGSNRICTAMQKLKVILQRSAVKEKCSPDCPCESSGWRVQTISLTALEEVEINGFEGDNHELDFLKLVLRCVPMLKRMIVKLSDKASASSCRRTKLYNIFRANSSVEFYVYLSSGLMHGSQNCLST
ncbi:unnamed protein product [Triticum turgidum subsp. durum]|uniref:F-box/LRR-repeat protein 15/At3g58940/PEG3-like LRR domain-containing protein n=1 Tax=Triticum turgidum subsp. durum TaxID=4567 RepID=A0A9R1PS77_TRITD|nr:unnamed protein product [Triticum turgidum subsp. durum]